MSPAPRTHPPPSRSSLSPPPPPSVPRAAARRGHTHGGRRAGDRPSGGPLPCTPPRAGRLHAPHPPPHTTALSPRKPLGCAALPPGFPALSVVVNPCLCLCSIAFPQKVCPVSQLPQHPAHGGLRQGAVVGGSGPHASVQSVRLSAPETTESPLEPSRGALSLSAREVRQPSPNNQSQPGRNTAGSQQEPWDGSGSGPRAPPGPGTAASRTAESLGWRCGERPGWPCPGLPRPAPLKADSGPPRQSCQDPERFPAGEAQNSGSAGQFRGKRI